MFALVAYLGISTHLAAAKEAATEALLAAAKSGDAKAVAEALSAGADIEATNYKVRLTPIMLCALHGHYDVCKLLLEKKARIDQDGAVTPLGFAVYRRDRRIAELLLAKKINVNQPCDVNMGGEIVYATPLMIAVWNNDLEMMELLLKNKANPNLVVKSNNRSAIMIAVRENRLEAMELLIKYKVKTNVTMMPQSIVTPAHYAIENGQKEMAHLIIKSQKKPEPNLLVAAIDAGDTETAKLLLVRGANPRYVAYNGENALMAAARTQNEELVQIFALRTNVNAVENGETALSKAAAEGNINLVRQLLAVGARQDIRLRENWTPLMYALWHKHEAVALLLLDHGAKTDTRNIDGYSIAMLAVLQDFYPVAERVINRKNANETFRMNGNFTLLDLAASNNSPRMIELLLQNGARIDQPADDGETPLMTAIRKGHVEAARVLLKNGASTTVTNKEGRNARALAEEYKAREILKLMDK